MSDETKIEQGTQDVPRFDLEDLSWGETVEATIAKVKVQEAIRHGDQEKLLTAFEEVYRHLARCVVYVPPSWVTSRAPADLDWRDPASFKWIKAHRMRELSAQLGQVKDDRGN